MTLITRISRLFRADLHAVLDQIEEPDALLRQAVREMEEDLARDERELKATQHEQRQLQARAFDLEQSQQRLAGELDVCFESGTDDLARTLIRRRLETEQVQKSLSRRQEAVEQALAILGARIEEHRMRLESMRQKAELFTDDRAADPADDLWSAVDFSVRAEDVEVAFLREKQRRQRS